MIKQFTKLLFGLTLLIISGVAKSQVSAYTFAASSGTYTDIVGGTAVATSTSVADFLGDTKTSVALPLGFSFVFDGVPYTQVKAVSDGFLSFNASATSALTNNLATGSTLNRPLVAPLWDDLDGASGSGAANYITTGSAGSQVFTIEWKNWQWNYNATGATISFQVKLYEGSNKIEFIYRQEAGALNSPSASIGIAGATTGAGNYLSLNNATAAPTASSTTETTSIATKPATGQIYTFTPPPACTGTPTGGTAVSSYSNVCSGSQFLLSVTNATSGVSGLTYVWQSSPDNTTWTNIATATGPTLATTQTAATYYRRNTICSGNTGSSTSVLVGLSGPANIPYTENFDGVIAPALANCITVENVNGDAGSTWNTIAANFTGSSAPNVMRYNYSTTLAADDWFFLRGINLTAGTAYAITFNYSGSSFTEKMEVRVGTSPTSASALSGPQLFNNAAITGAGIGNGSFTPTVTGVYYFGFHAYSAADQFNLSVDNITVDLPPLPPGCTTNILPANGATNVTTPVTLTWNAAPNATSYDVYLGTTPTMFTLLTNVTGTTATITNTTGNTTYYWYVAPRNAGGGATTCQSTATSFTTALPPVCTTNISPANRATDVIIPFTLTWNAAPGATSYDVYFGTDPASLPNIGNVTGTSAGVTNTLYNTTYYWYVAPKNAGGANTTCQSTATNFTTSAPPPPPPNDVCANAGTLIVSNGFCMNPVAGTLAGADSTSGLGAPSCAYLGTSQKYDVWYKLTVPATGRVSIRTHALRAGSGNDLQIVAYSGACGTLTPIGCDDDGNPDAGANSLQSWLGVTGQTPASTLYIRVTAYGASSIDSFSICAYDTSASVLPAMASSSVNACVPGNSVTITQTNANNYVWVPLMDASGNIIAELNANGNNLGAITSSYYRNTNAVRIANSYYLDRNFTITPSAQPTQSASGLRPSIRLYFTNSELTAFAAVAGATTRAQLMITKNNDPCSGAYSDNGKYALGAINASGAYNSDHYIEDSVSSFSSFFIHRTGTVLPISLEYLKGLRAGTGNALNWKINCTSVSITMELERSSDSRSFKSITSITASQARCGQPFDYVDANPLKGINYYRLKMIDVDGKVTYSPIVAIINGTTGAELVGIYPTVVRDEAFLSVAASRSTKLQVNITDMSGRIIKTISQTVANGSTLLSINTAHLSTGVYNVTGMLDGVQTKTLRFVKQ